MGRLLSVALTLLLSAPSLALAAQSQLDAFDDLRLEGPPLAAEHRTYLSGRLTVDMTSGIAIPVRAANRVVGIFFSGSGEFDYRSEDPFASVNFSKNVKDRTKVEVTDETLRDEMSSALVIDLALVDSIAGLDVPYDAPSDQLRKAFDRHIKAFAKDEEAPCYNLAVQALLEDRRDAIACVQISGRNDYIHVRDQLRGSSEGLYVMHLTEARALLPGHRFPYALSHQMIGLEPMKRAPARWLVRHLDVDLVNPEMQRMELTVRETIEVLTPLKTLAFRLDDKRYDGEELIPIDLESVTDTSGQRLAFSRQGPDVLVELPRPYRAGEKLDLEFELSGEVLHRPGGHSFWWLGIGYWLPLPRRWDQANFTFHSVVKVAPPFVPFSMGRVVRRWQEDGLEAAEFEIKKPVQFAVILAGKYHTHSETRDGLTIHLASYGFKRNESMKKIANNTFELIKFYKPLLGDFPFAELSILEINAYGFGQAPPGVIYLTREAFDPGPAGRRYRSELNHRMAHEVAHQWWGHVAQMADPREQWLSETTAEYYSALALKRLMGERKFNDSARSWKEGAGQLRGMGSIYYANRITNELGRFERYGLLYAQGPLMLQEMHERLGDETFLTIFKSLLSSFPHQAVDSDTFVRLTNHITKEDWRPWFEEAFMTALDD